jgi:hypothetical protein
MAQHQQPLHSIDKQPFAQPTATSASISSLCTAQHKPIAQHQQAMPSISSSHFAAAACAKQQQPLK